MARALNMSLRVVAAVLVGLVAAAGLAATAAYVLVGTRAGTSVLVPRVLALVNGAIQGRLELDSLRVHSAGTVELEGVRVRDPGGKIVIAAERALARVSVAQLRLRVVAAEVEIDRPRVLLEQTADGGLTIAQAFRSRRPSPKEEQPGESRWTVRLDRLAVRGGAVELVDARGERRLAAGALDIDGRAATSRAGSDAEVRLQGAFQAPVEGKASLDAVASLRDGVARVARLRAAVGQTAIDALGEWDLASRSGRAAVRSVAVDAVALAQVLPSSPLAGDFAGSLFAAAAEGVATAAFDLAQRGGSGSVSGAAAVRMSSPLALGFEVSVDRLDPARVVATAPPGEVTLRARGGLTGTDPATLGASVDLESAPSTVRGVRVGAVTLRGTARAGAYDVAALDAQLPGARLRGSGRYALGGAVAADARLEASDLASTARGVERIAGIELPPIAGRANLLARVGGTVRAPQATFDLTAPRLAVAGVRAAGLELDGEIGGSLERPQARVKGSAAELGVGGEVFRTVAVAGSIDDRAAEARVTAITLRVGPDPLTIGARGDFARNWRAIDLSALTVAWPGTEYALSAPARLSFAGPRVDRLELASGPTRISLEGGLASAPGPRRRAPPRTVADARVTVEALDLARLPRELLPPALGLAGVVRVDARATGPLSAPEVVAHAEAVDGAVYGISGLSLDADAAWDGAARRARLTATSRRSGGGEVELRADLPAALMRAPRSEPVAIWLRASGLPLEEISRLAAAPETAAGTTDVEVTLDGTVGAPEITGKLALRDAQYAGYGPYRADAALDAPGHSAKLDVTAGSDGTDGADGARAIEVTASVPLDLARFLRAPAEGARALLDAPLSGQAEAPEFELARFAGDFGLPADVAGRVRGGATLGGTLRAPRGSLGLEASGVAAYGYKDASMQLALLLSDDATGVAGSVAVAGEELVQLSGFLEAPVERLTALAQIESTPLDLDVLVPGADLAHTGGQVPLAGRIEGRVRARGSLRAPDLDLALEGKKVSISGKPLGDAAVKGKAAGRDAAADVRIQAAAGGVLTASLHSDVDVSLDALRRGDLAKAPSELRIVADRLGLGVLAALLPGTVRTASGELGADLTASGPLTSLWPVGQVRVTNGQIAIAEMGDWSGIELDASVTADSFKVDRLHAKRGKGSFDAAAEVRGLARIAQPAGAPAELTAQLTARSLTIPRKGQDLATLDFEARAKGTVGPRRLDAEVTIPKGTVELPERAPRQVQTLERREDIVIVSSFGAEPTEKEDEQKEKESAPYRATVRVIVPGRLFITSPNPRMNIELKADATFDVVGANTYAEGKVEVLRGYVEPIGGRNFTVQRGRLTFTGAGPEEAALDVEAHYKNPSAEVTVTVTGTTKQPVVKMTSVPPLDESQIAMLIATGSTELKPGSGGVGTLTGEEAGRAAVGAVATQLFKNVVADKLPVDSVALSSSEIRAGKYVTDKIYVGYTRNFEAQPEEGDNTNEVRVEYRISPRWTLESRYGDANTGSASLIWSKDY